MGPKNILACLSVLLFSFSQACAQDEWLARMPGLLRESCSAVGLPFSFVYDDKQSHDFLCTWEKTVALNADGNDKEIYTLRYSDHNTGLEVIAEVTIFKGYQAVAWVLYFKNTGSEDTPIIKSILALDLEFEVPDAGEILLHSLRGSSMDHQDYRPVKKKLPVGKEIQMYHLSPSRDMPYLNLQWSQGGLMGAIGGSLFWHVVARRLEDRGVLVQAGQKNTNFKLLPGETVRSPSIVLLQWDGPDRFSGHNQWRKLFLEHYALKRDGQIVMPPVSHTSAYVKFFNAVARETGKNPLGVLPTLTRADVYHKPIFPITIYESLYAVTEQNQLTAVRELPEIGLETFWMDAGWYEARKERTWTPRYGNWVAKESFPRGLKPISDEVHKRKMTYLLWFSPASSRPEDDFLQKHPGSVIGDLFNYGDPNGFIWLLNLLSQRIDQWDIDIFRHDHVTGGIGHLQSADAPDREGIAEIKWVMGLHALWDELIKRHPGLIIDNAQWKLQGSDIEKFKRTVGCLTRSESAGPSIPHPEWDQMQTASLSLWIPIHSTLVHGVDPYTFRSAATMGVAIGLDLGSDYVPIAELTKAIGELKSLRRYWLGDYYPLTKIDNDKSHWCAWQFDRPDLKSGFAMFFRRPECAVQEIQCGLQGIDDQAIYEIALAETYDTKERRKIKGRHLRKLTIHLDQAPSSMLLRYRMVSEE